MTDGAGIDPAEPSGVRIRRVQNVSHWDEVEPETVVDPAHLRATWRDLGRAAGSDGASVQLVDIAPGCRSTPVHQHFHEEELAFVLAGSGWSWQDGALHPLEPDDVVLYAAEGPPHTLVAGEDGLRALIFGAEPPAPVTFLPRARVMRTGGAWVDYVPGSAHPFLREPPDLPGEPAAERPSNICSLGDVPPEREAHGRTDLVSRPLAERLRPRRTAMQHVTVAPGAESWPPHCHSAEEELFVVLGGEGAVVLGAERIPLRRGSCVARPPGTRVAHQFLGPLTLLAWSTREPNDIVFYPRSRKVYLRGVGVRFPVEPAGIWDGEPG